MQPHDFLMVVIPFSEIHGSFLFFNNIYYILSCIWVSYLKCRMVLSKQHGWPPIWAQSPTSNLPAAWLGKVTPGLWNGLLLCNSRKGNNSYFSRVCVKTSGNNVSQKSLVQYLNPKRGLINVPPLIFFTRLSASQSVGPFS